MKIEVTLSKEEHAALRSAPGRSDQQRLRWLCKFWGAVEKENRDQGETVQKAEESWTARDVDANGAPVAGP